MNPFTSSTNAFSAGLRVEKSLVKSKEECQQKPGDFQFSIAETLLRSLKNKFPNVSREIWTKDKAFLSTGAFFSREVKMLNSALAVPALIRSHGMLLKMRTRNQFV